MQARTGDKLVQDSGREAAPPRAPLPAGRVDGRTKVPKAVIYYGGFLERAGGAFMHARMFSAALEMRGWQVEVVTLDRLPLLLRYLPHVVLRVVNLVNAPLGFFYKDRTTRALYKLFLNGDADVKIFEDVYLSWNTNMPAVTILHAVWSDNLQGLQASDTQRQKLVCREAALINRISHPLITVSEPYRQFLDTTHFRKFKLRPITVVPLGVDVTKWGAAATAERTPNAIIYCGSLEARKNLRFLIDVFERLWSRDRSYRLTMIGDGPDARGLEEYASAKGVPVRFLGRMSHDQVIRELPRHSIYLHTSTKESFSFALLEAKLSRLTTVAFSGLEVPAEFIDVPVDRFDLDAWCDAIRTRPVAPRPFDGHAYSSDAMTEVTLSLGLSGR